MRYITFIEFTKLFDSLLNSQRLLEFDAKAQEQPANADQILQKRKRMQSIIMPGLSVVCNSAMNIPFLSSDLRGRPQIQQLCFWGMKVRIMEMRTKS